MDVVKFIEERNRMCRSYDDECRGCPAFNACDDEVFCSVSVMSKLGAKEQVAIVEKWSKEHPKKKKKTRQDVFIEQYPDAVLDGFGVLRICPIYISADYRDNCNLGKNIGKKCSDCRREFWMQEVE